MPTAERQTSHAPSILYWTKSRGLSGVKFLRVRCLAILWTGISYFCGGGVSRVATGRGEKGILVWQTSGVGARIGEDRLLLSVLMVLRVQ